MKALPSTLLMLLSLATTAAWAGKAHQHGVAQLDVAVEPTRLTLVLDTPLDSLLGFERAPRTDAERAAVDKTLALLRAAEPLFRIDSAAGCTLGKVVLVAPVLGLGTETAAGKTAEKTVEKTVEKGQHADLTATFDFNCKEASRARFVEVELFKAFAPMKRIELQLVLPRGQMKATLVRPATRVALAR